MSRRSERWEAEAGRRRNGWAPLAWLSLLLGVGAAVVTVLGARGEVQVSDGLGVALVAVTPSLGLLAVIIGIVATRRETLRVLSWAAVVLAALLVLGSVAAVVAMLVALDGLS